MTQDRSTHKPVTVYPSDSLRAWVEEEGRREGRNLTRQIEYFLEEARRVREHNRKAASDEAGARRRRVEIEHGQE